MKSKQKQTLSLFAVIVTLFLTVLFFSTNSLAASPSGTSDGSEAAISSSLSSNSSEEVLSNESSSEEESSSSELSSTEESSQATAAGTSAGASFQRSGPPGISAFSIAPSAGFTTYTLDYTEPTYLFSNSGNPELWDPWGPYPEGIIEDGSSLLNGWNPYNNLASTTDFKVPIMLLGGTNFNYYYSYATFAWDSQDMYDFFESLYIGCGDDFQNYMNGIGAASGDILQTSQVTGFMDTTFQTGYANFLSTYADGTGFKDSELNELAGRLQAVQPGLETTINDTVPSKHSINRILAAGGISGSSIYYLDLNSTFSSQNKSWSGYMDPWYYLLGFCTTPPQVVIYGVDGIGSSGGSGVWSPVYTGVSGSFDGFKYDPVIVGYGTPSKVNIDFYLFEGSDVQITGFWGSTTGAIGGRTFARNASAAQINLYSTSLSAFDGSPLVGLSGQKYLVGSFGGNLHVGGDDGIHSVDFASTHNVVYNSALQNTTLPYYLENSVANTKCMILVSPVMFGQVNNIDDIVEIQATNNINFNAYGSGFTPSDDSTPAEVALANNISSLSIGGGQWIDGDNIDPQFNIVFNSGTHLGSLDSGSFIFTGTTNSSTITVENGAMEANFTAVPYTNKATFTLERTQIAKFTSNESDLQLFLQGSAIQEATLNGPYNFSGDMSVDVSTVDSVIRGKGTTLINTQYIVAGAKVEDGDAIVGNPYIKDLTINNSGSSLDFSVFDLRYSYAHNITLNDLTSTLGDNSTILLPNIDYLPYQYDNSGVYSAKNTIINLGGSNNTSIKNLAITGGEKLTEVNFDPSGSLASQLEVLDLSWTGSGTPSSAYPRQLAAQPIITGWTAPTSPSKNLIVKNTGITHFYSYEGNSITGAPMYPEDITGLDITNAGLTTSVLKEVSIWNKDYATPTGSTSQMTKLAYKDGNEASLEIINFNGLYQVTEDGYNPSTPVGASISYVFSKKAETTGLFLTALKEVHYDYLTQFTSSTTDPVIINLSDNKIAQFTMSNCIPTSAVASSSLDSLNLSGNELTIARNGQTLGVNGNQFSAFNTLISGTIDLSRNKLIEVDFDGSNNTDNFTTPGTPVNVFGQTIDLSNQQNQISVTELGGINWGNVSNGVKILNNDQLEVLNITSDKINGFELVNLPNLTNIEGTAHHGTPISSPATLIVGKATFDNLGPNLAAPTSVGGAKELNFEGHGITYLTVQNMPDFDVLNFRRQNSTGDVAPAATQGALRTVNLVNGTGRDIDTIDVSYNSIERVTNGGVGSAFASVLDGSINYLGVKFVGNATVNADFNNITDVDILGTRFSGGDTLKTLRLNDNFLTNLTYTDSGSLTNLLTNRSETGRNTFVNGKVILRNDSALLYFAPSTSVLADKDEDSKFNRVNPVIPSESRWAQDSPGGMTPVAADYSNMASGTFGTDFGFYTSVPITDLDISGCTSLTTLRVPGNHLTNNSLNWSNTGNMEFLDVSGAPYLTTDANGTHAGTSTTKPRGGRYTTVNVAPAGVQEAGSGQLTGAFIGQWPKLQSLYIQNNQIQQLDIGTSTSTVHILAYQNQLGQGLSSDAVKVSTATALTVLDVERNPNIGILTVPTQNLEILRAGLAGLKQYPNVQNISTLKQLYVDHNNLSGVAEPVTGNPNLEVLNIAGNAFTELPNVQPLAHLEEYYAYNNNATSLGTFNENGALAILDVADNLLSSWPSLPNSIVYLDLSRNRFGGVLDIPGVPAGLSRTTPYIAKAHEVTALENDTATGGSYYVQTSEFYGTFAIEDNQITALPDSLKQAFIDMKNNVSGRTVYRMFVNWNVLDIDVYGLDASGNPVPSFTGTQKWVAMYPGITPTLLNYVSEEKLEMVLRGSVGLYDPRSNLPVEDINAFEAPYPYQEWEYGWEETNDLIYNGEVDRSGVAIAKVRIIDNPGRNGRALVGINLYDHMLETNPDKKDKGGKKVVDGSQDAGEVLNDLLGDNSNYNPTTGAEGNK